MEKRRVVRLVVIIASLAAIACAVSIIGFRQNAAASAARRRAIAPVMASYERPQGSVVARDSRILSDSDATLVSAPVEPVADDPLQAIPSHKRYAIVGEGPMPAEAVQVPMGVARAEDQ